MFKVENIDVYYDTLKVLKDVSLEMEDDECIGVLGANGHGKTTLLKTISGLLRPKNGTIEIDGTIISDIPPRKIVEKGIIHVPQGSKLFPNMTVKENLELGAYTPNVWKNRKEKLEQIYEIFPVLEEKKNDKSSSLSGGQRQMVAIGRGLMSSVKILMLDEPTVGLAPKLRQDLMKKIHDIKDTGIGMIIVEQNVSYIKNLTDRAYLLENGRITLEGNTEEVLDLDEVKSSYLGM